MSPALRPCRFGSGTSAVLGRFSTCRCAAPRPSLRAKDFSICIPRCWCSASCRLRCLGRFQLLVPPCSFEVSLSRPPVHLPLLFISKTLRPRNPLPSIQRQAFRSSSDQLLHFNQDTQAGASTIHDVCRTCTCKPHKQTPQRSLEIKTILGI